MKTRFFLAGIFLILIMQFASAGFTKGNATYSLERDYSSGENLRGWINISLSSEPAESRLEGFSSGIPLLEFLENAGAGYSCSPGDCSPGYSASSESASKSFSLSIGSSKIIGMKVTESSIVTDISSFSFDVQSNALESNYYPLFIDVLADGEKDWQSYLGSGNFGNEIYGCYNSSEAGETALIKITTAYCERITVPVSPSVKLGADINGSGAANFTMSLLDSFRNPISSCYASAGASGKISCNVSTGASEDSDYFVCISAKTSADNDKYSVLYEQNAPCGFSGSSSSTDYDFPLFVQAGKFSALGSFRLNNSEITAAGLKTGNLESEIENYLDAKYLGNCSSGCVIPLKFSSMKQQDIVVSGAFLSYTAGIAKTSASLYDLANSSVAVSSGFQKLDLSKAGISAPASAGNHSFSLKLGSTEIFSDVVEIRQLPVIDAIIPAEIPSQVPILFIAFVSGNVSSYEWDFGDSTGKQVTSVNSTYHAYNSTGNYTLTLKASNSLGNSSKQLFVSVLAPAASLNSSLAGKRRDLNSVSSQISNMTLWYKNFLAAEAQISSRDSSLAGIERRYAAASSSEYSAILADLNKLEIPSSISMSESSSGAFILNPENINAAYLNEMSHEEISSPENYQNAIAKWFSENIDMSVERKVYSASYGASGSPIATYVRLKITPLNDYGKESYLLIGIPFSEISFKEDYQAKQAGEGTGIAFSELENGAEKIIEFIAPGKIEMISLPVYFSPEFAELPELAQNISACNFNSICEPEKSENWRNCRNDCKPWGKFLFYVLLVAFFAFIVYIILQEWYKRYYERYLFRNKNDLFNVINFINNALNQSIEKDEIMSRLKEHGWSSEQVTYAYKKLRGYRTGMLEIPLFRFWEKRRVRKEIEKRQALQLPASNFRKPF